MRQTVALCAVLVTLAGCGGAEGAEKAQPAPLAASTSAEPAPIREGPASEPGDLGGGVTAEVVSAAAKPAEQWMAEDNPGHDTRITLHVRLSAEQETPLTVDELGGTGVQADLLYGPNLTKANGWATGQETPTRITPDAPVTLTAEFSLPADGLEELRLVYGYDETSDPWTFTDVESLIG